MFLTPILLTSTPSPTVGPPYGRWIVDPWTSERERTKTLVFLAVSLWLKMDSNVAFDPVPWATTAATCYESHVFGLRESSLFEQFFLHMIAEILPGWWLQTFSIFHNIWDNPSHWLMWHMWQSDAKWPAEKQRFQSSNVCRALVPSPWAPGVGRRGEDAALPFSSPFCWSSQNAWFMMVYGVYNCLLFHDSSCFIQFWFLSKKISKKNMTYYPMINKLMVAEQKATTNCLGLIPQDLYIKWFWFRTPLEPRTVMAVIMGASNGLTRWLAT